MPIKRAFVTMSYYYQRKPVYTPAADVASPEVPHFVKVAFAQLVVAEHRTPHAGAIHRSVVRRRFCYNGGSVEAYSCAAPLFVGI